MPENIRISVCIPTYNKCETIEYAILSVINQTYQLWELIVIDDSNNNCTEELVKKYTLGDKRVQYIKNKERLGLVKNWNECVKKASFEYIYILHHDDFLLQGVLQDYIDFLKNHPQCGLVHSNYLYITLPYYGKIEIITQYESILKKGDKAIEKILFNNNIGSSSVMVKKDCYDKLEGFDEKVYMSPDWEMWARIGKNYDIGHLDILGCVVIMDNKNTHLSDLEINDLYIQQQYYYGKIISYFSEGYLTKNPKITESAEENLKNTILDLGFYYIERFSFRTAISYLNKIRYRNIFNILKIVLKSMIKKVYVVSKFNKMNHQQVFKLFYK